MLGLVSLQYVSHMTQKGTKQGFALKLTKCRTYWSRLSYKSEIACCPFLRIQTSPNETIPQIGKRSQKLKEPPHLGGLGAY